MIITKRDDLEQPCKDISILEASSVINLLENELESHPSGIGLAANQIGIDARVVIVRYNRVNINLVNPKIIKAYDKRLFMYDGCLSFPGDQISTARYNEIFVIDSIHPNGFVSFGMEAVVLQHEVDHINGITMYDRKINVPDRNETCWCKSGKKYKKCCLGKEIKIN